MKTKILTCLLSLGLTIALPTASWADSSAKETVTVDIQVPAALRGFVPLHNPVAMPKVRLFTKDGEEVDLNKYHGKVLILNLWASWCMPCIQEIPALAKMQKKLEGSNVMIMGVNLEQTTNQVLKFLEKKKYEGFQTWLDPTMSVPSALPISGIPTNLILNGNGEIIAMVAGYAQWDAPEVAKFLKELEKKYSKPSSSAEKKL